METQVHLEMSQEIDLQIGSQNQLPRNQHSTHQTSHALKTLSQKMYNLEIQDSSKMLWNFKSAVSEIFQTSFVQRVSINASAQSRGSKSNQNNIWLKLLHKEVKLATDLLVQTTVKQWKMEQMNPSRDSRNQNSIQMYHQRDQSWEIEAAWLSTVTTR